MEINEGNKLIAGFMGGKNDKINFAPKNIRFRIPINGTYSFHVTKLQYHSSWDWLMPVVEKIQSLHCNVNIINKYCQIIRFKDGGSGEIEYTRTWTMADTKIENTWQSAISFIQWYNTLSPESTQK